MAQKAIGLLETRGLIGLVQGTDTMLKAANVQLVGPMKQVGSALVSAVITGDVAAVQAADIRSMLPADLSCTACFSAGMMNSMMKTTRSAPRHGKG